MSSTGRASKPRDVRLDFFRGMAMLIIIIAHIPTNPWNNWIPARFGFSSAAEMFVFCSGFASALAFGSVFVKRSFGLGLARIGQRIWQLYWAQIAVFMFTVVLSVWATRTLGTGDYIASLYLEWFIEKPAEALPALMTLRYIPNFFDMLPMYMVLLALVPLVILIARVSPLLVFAGSVGLWLFVQFTTFNLAARPNSDLVWFFNPLAWQLLFFAGFSFAMGWLKPPPLNDRRLVMVALAIVIACVPVSFWGFHMLIPELGVLHDRILPDSIPTDLHIVRLIHFFALAYLALGLVARWQDAIAESALLRPVIRVGQQTFAVFLVSVPLAWSMGMLLDVFGRGPLMLILANLGGIAIALGIAWAVAWFKSQPWRKPASETRPAQDLKPALERPEAAVEIAVRAPVAAAASP
jgi:hypothetical protein